MGWNDKPDYQKQTAPSATGLVLFDLGGRDDLLPLCCIAIDDFLELGGRLPLDFKNSGRTAKI
jgi:hypothetical protein